MFITTVRLERHGAVRIRCEVGPGIPQKRDVGVRVEHLEISLEEGEHKRWFYLGQSSERARAVGRRFVAARGVVIHGIIIHRHYMTAERLQFS